MLDKGRLMAYPNRIISARKANRKEVADYEHNAHQD